MKLSMCRPSPFRLLTRQEPVTHLSRAWPLASWRASPLSKLPALAPQPRDWQRRDAAQPALCPIGLKPMLCWHDMGTSPLEVRLTERFLVTGALGCIGAWTVK